MTVIATISLTMLASAAILCLAAALRPRTIADRAVAVESLVAIIICGLAAAAVQSGDGMFADLALVLGLLGFLAVTTVAHYITQRRP